MLRPARSRDIHEPSHPVLLTGPDACTRQGLSMDRPGAAFAHLARLIAVLGARVQLWSRRRSERHTVRDLDDRGLRDLGLNRSDVEREELGWFWDRRERR